MASHNSANDPDSTPNDSVASTPRSDNELPPAAAPQPPRVRFMCSFGGRILPRPHDNHLRYVGGDTRIVAVHRHAAAAYSSLLSKLSKISGTTNISVKYQLPNEDLDSLITVASDEDVENMIEEYDRHHKSARLRVFLFPADYADSRASSINSLLDGSAKRGSWFVDALNGGPGHVSSVLDRGRSDLSSVVSEVPDYLFGLDSSEESSTKIKSRNLTNDAVSISDPGSPATSSPNLQILPDLPPVRIKPVNNPVQAVETKESEMMVVNEKMVSQGTGYSGGPMWHYPNPPVYYVSQPGNIPYRPQQFVQPYQVGPGQVPVGYSGTGQVYGTGVRPYDQMPARIYADNASQAVYYGARNVAVVPGSYPGMVVSGGEEMVGPGNEVVTGRVSQGS